jgi:hypothetical protein
MRESAVQAQARQADPDWRIVDSFPQAFDAGNVPGNVRKLVDELVPQLLVGDDPAHETLRRQFSAATISEVELSGAGFFVEFSYDAEPARVRPDRITGGDARITLEGESAPAGCVVFVVDGVLSAFEVYTNANPWTKRTRVLRVDDVVPLPVLGT